MEREGQRERRRDSRININGPSKAINRAFLPPFVSRERGGSAPAETFAPTLISFDNLGIRPLEIHLRPRELQSSRRSLRAVRLVPVRTVPARINPQPIAVAVAPSPMEPIPIGPEHPCPVALPHENSPSTLGSSQYAAAVLARISSGQLPRGAATRRAICDTTLVDTHVLYTYHPHVNRGNRNAITSYETR